MASSQTQRQQERLARQRGAGTHKIVNAGFSIQPLGGSFVAPAAPPPPRKAVTPPLELPVRGSVPPLSRVGSLVAELITRETIAPLEELDVAHRKSFYRRSPITDEPVPNISSSMSTTTIQSTASKPSAVAAVTPVARGKRTRQPSPDKFLTTPEAARIGRQLIGRRINMAADQRQKEKLAVRQRGAGTHKVADLGFSIQSIPGTPLATRSLAGGGEENGIVEPERVKVGVEVAGAVREVVKGVQQQGQKVAKLKLGEEGGEGGEEQEVGGEGMERRVEEQTMEGIEMEGEQSIEEVVGPMIQQVAQEVRGGPGDDVPVTLVQSPENRNKRRKVILKYRKKEVPEELGDHTSESILRTEEGISTEKELEIPNTKHKRQTIGKKPASPHVSVDKGGEDGEDGEDGQEEGWKEGEEGEERGEEPTEGTLEQQDLSDLEEIDDLNAPSRLKSRKKVSTQPQKQARLKSHRRAHHEGGPPTFPVLVHRLSKSTTHTLPPRVKSKWHKYWAKFKSSHERKAIEVFKEELSYRFLELTDAVESNIILAARAKRAQKRKAQLMIELLEVKRQRERVAVKMDDVRKVHEMATKSAEDQNNISKTFSDITHTLERGKARRPEDGERMAGLEALIRKVSNAVTGGGSEGTGLLANVVDFNRFLERAEVVLRERSY